MKNQASTNLIIRSGVGLALVLAIWFPGPSQSAEPAEGKMMMPGQMMERCQEMKEQKQKMMADMKAQDAELTEQVAKMNSAPEDKKLSLMAAVITRMAEQQAAMNARKAKMDEEMMTHMMQHVQMGKDSLSQCPMMKGMQGMQEMKGMEGMHGMKGMDEKPGSVQPAASDAEHAFLQTMVPHHELAIEMARMAQQRAKNPTIRSMANEIIRIQSGEIEKMKAIHQRLFGSELIPDKMAHERLGLTMEQSGMAMDMERLEKATNFDKVFVEDMTTHHQGAINMARKVLETAPHEEIRKLAEAIIEAQTKEIKTLETTR